MKLKQILNEHQPSIIEFSKLFMSRSGISDALVDAAGKRTSQTQGPIEIIIINRQPQLVDGYHRVVEAILNGVTALPTIIMHQNGSYPMLGGVWRTSRTPLQGLEELIDLMDDEQLQMLLQYPLVMRYIDGSQHGRRLAYS